MNTPWRWSIIILAGLAWVFLARLADDGAATLRLAPILIASPLVTTALLLPYRAGLVTLLTIALLLDAGTGIPFGLSATLLAPVHLILHRLRHQVPRDSVAIATLLAACITPALWIARTILLHWQGYPLPGDLAGALSEITLSTLLVIPGTAWLFIFYRALVERLGPADELAYERP